MIINEYMKSSYICGLKPKKVEIETHKKSIQLNIATSHG